MGNTKIKWKKTRRYCACCKCVRYPRRLDADRDAHFLCKTCMGAYITWRDEKGGIYVDTFLKSYAAKKLRAAQKLRNL